MPQYELAASAEADALEAQAAGYGTLVIRDIERADNYMLAVVLFATALFFAALSTRLHTFGSRATLLGLGYAAFLGTAVWLATQPISLSV
jgi:hypothetical protein